jgi:hypothetical protein
MGRSTLGHMTENPAEENEQSTVHDRVTAPGGPIPREQPGAPEADSPPSNSDAAARADDTEEDAADAGENEPAGPSGPAEKQDERTPDDRGLTTETNPTD